MQRLRDPGGLGGVRAGSEGRACGAEQSVPSAPRVLRVRPSAPPPPPPPAIQEPAAGVVGLTQLSARPSPEREDRGPAAIVGPFSNRLGGPHQLLDRPGPRRLASSRAWPEGRTGPALARILRGVGPREAAAEQGRRLISGGRKLLSGVGPGGLRRASATIVVLWGGGGAGARPSRPARTPLDGRLSERLGPGPLHLGPNSETSARSPSRGPRSRSTWWYALERSVPCISP